MVPMWWAKAGFPIRHRLECDAERAMILELQYGRPLGTTTHSF